MSKIVMFVDDDDAFLMVARRVSREISAVASVLEATDGVAGLRLIEARLHAGEPCPDVLFVDINMPVLDGFGFLGGFIALRQRFSQLERVRPIVMLTSSQQELDRERAMSMGADGYIVKGSSLDEIRTGIEREVT